MYRGFELSFAIDYLNYCHGRLFPMGTVTGAKVIVLSGSNPAPLMVFSFIILNSYHKAPHKTA